MKFMPQKIMIFGRPGSGKSSFASLIAQKTRLPLHHLDKHFFISNWIERDYTEFLNIQRKLVNETRWIIDGNSIRSLEMRWARADFVIYFNYNKWQCLFRLIKRCFMNKRNIDDRAPHCPEIIRWPLVKYMWNFEKRVDSEINILRGKYPNTTFIKITSDTQLKKLYDFTINA